MPEIGLFPCFVPGNDTMFDLGGGELLLILVAVLILFGPKKLPELAQGLGKGLRQFRQAQREFTEQINTAIQDEQRKETAARARPGAANTIARSAGEPPAATQASNAENAEPGGGSNTSQDTEKGRHGDAGSAEQGSSNTPTDTETRRDGDAAKGDAGTEGSAG